MTDREQEPWQRSIRKAREQRGWDIVPSVEPPCGLSAPEIVVPPGDILPPAPRDQPESESVWRASASFGKLNGFLLSFGFLVLTVVSIWRFRATDGAGSLLAAAAAITCAASAAGIIYLLRGLTTIRYVVGTDSVTIVWMGQQRVIPFDDILDIVYEPREAIRGRGYELFWPGYHVSTMQMRDGAWHSVATQQPKRRIRIVTRRGIHAVSPYRPILFLGELARRRQMHATGTRYDVEPAPIPPPRWTRPTRAIPAASDISGRPDEVTIREERSADDSAAPEPPVRPTAKPEERARRAGVAAAWLSVYRDLFRERLLGDPIASGLVAVGVMIPMLMVAFLYSQYEGIASVVPLHWNAHGDVDAVGTRRDLWRLPLIATLILILNSTLATALVAVDRFMARFLVAVTPAAQMIAFIALIRAAT
jgi:hypothetical protein